MAGRRPPHLVGALALALTQALVVARPVTFIARALGATAAIVAAADNAVAKHGEAEAGAAPAAAWPLYVASVVLVLLGGAFAGLTIALMGQDSIYLQVMARDPNEPQSRNAKRVFDLLNRGKHWVLVTLLLGNVIVNESLPVVLDRCLGGGLAAIVGSTVLIVIFGEVLPQSVCVRYGLAIGGCMSGPVLVLMYLLAPIAWPIAKLLDRMLGEDHGTVYKRTGLKALVGLHQSLGEAGDRLNEDEVTIISAVLDLKAKQVGNVMTPMEDVFTVSEDTVLDEKTMDRILSEGYSRIPVHAAGQPTNFVGMLLVKILITYDPEDGRAVREFPLATLPETRPETSCLDIINFFQEGKSHMVLVSESPGEDRGALGIVCLEDVIEELIGEEIIDESDVYIDVHKAIRRLTPAPNARPHYHHHHHQSRLRSDHHHHHPGAGSGAGAGAGSGAGAGPGDLLSSDSAASPAGAAAVAADLGEDYYCSHPAHSGGGAADMDSLANLSASPRMATILLRRASAGPDGQLQPGVAVPVRANLDDVKHTLKFLGPSNPATNPRNTRSTAVKIKPRTAGSGLQLQVAPLAAAAAAAPGRSETALSDTIIEVGGGQRQDDDDNPADGEDAPLLGPQNHGHLTGKSGVHAVRKSYGTHGRSEVQRRLSNQHAEDLQQQARPEQEQGQDQQEQDQQEQDQQEQAEQEQAQQDQDQQDQKQQQEHGHKDPEGEGDHQPGASTVKPSSTPVATPLSPDHTSATTVTQRHPHSRSDSGSSRRSSRRTSSAGEGAGVSRTLTLGGGLTEDIINTGGVQKIVIRTSSRGSDSNEQQQQQQASPQSWDRRQVWGSNATDNGGVGEPGQKRSLESLVITVDSPAVEPVKGPVEEPIQEAMEELLLDGPADSGPVPDSAAQQHPGPGAGELQGEEYEPTGSGAREPEEHAAAVEALAVETPTVETPAGQESALSSERSHDYESPAQTQDEFFDAAASEEWPSHGGYEQPLPSRDAILEVTAPVAALAAAPEEQRSHDGYELPPSSRDMAPEMATPAAEAPEEQRSHDGFELPSSSRSVVPEVEAPVAAAPEEQRSHGRHELTPSRDVAPEAAAPVAEPEEQPSHGYGLPSSSRDVTPEAEAPELPPRYQELPPLPPRKVVSEAAAPVAAPWEQRSRDYELPPSSLDVAPQVEALEDQPPRDHGLPLSSPDAIPKAEAPELPPRYQELSSPSRNVAPEAAPEEQPSRSHEMSVTNRDIIPEAAAPKEQPPHQGQEQQEQQGKDSQDPQDHQQQQSQYNQQEQALLAALGGRASSPRIELLRSFTDGASSQDSEGEEDLSASTATLGGQSTGGGSTGGSKKRKNRRKRRRGGQGW